MDIVLCFLQTTLDDKRKMLDSTREEIIKTEGYLRIVKESKEASEKCIKELETAIAVLQPLSTKLYKLPLQ